jgi:hypothetical protein
MEDRQSSSLFVHHGRLYTRRLNTSASPSSAKIAVFNGTDVSELVSVTWTGTNDEYWGPVFYFKDKAYWFAGFGGDPTYLYLYVFYDNGSGSPSLIRRRCDEMGTFTIQDVSNNATSNLNMYTSQAGVAGVTWRVEPHRDRLMMGPNGCMALNGNHVFVREYVGQFFINADNTVSLSPLYQPVATYATGYFSSGEPSYKGLSEGVVSCCHWKGAAYTVNFFGQVHRIDPSTGVRSLVFDITSDSTLQVPGGPWTTDFPGDSSTTLSFNAGNSTMNYQPHGRGGRVTIQNFNGIANNPVTGYILKADNAGGPVTVCDANGNVFPGQPVGTTFTVKWGLCGSFLSGPTASRFGYLFVYNDKLHLLALSSQSGATVSASHIPPWTLHVWDGTTLTNTVLAGSASPALGIGMVIDHESGLLHFLHNDYIAGAIKHKTIDLTSRTLSDNGTVCSYGTTSSNFGIDRFSMNSDKVQAYDPYDVTPGLTAASVDRFEGTVTIDYTLYGTASDVVSVGFQFNSGNGWSNATRRAGMGNGTTGLNTSPTGISYQFVHDAAADLGGGFFGSLAYRVQVVSQTRNS